MSHCAQVKGCPGGKCGCSEVVKAEEAASAALCGPVSDCVGGPVIGSTEVAVGPQIEEMGVA